jgi:hypothetical protein
MKFSKKQIAAVVAALLAILGAVKSVLDSLPESPAALPAFELGSVPADAGAP